MKYIISVSMPYLPERRRFLKASGLAVTALTIRPLQALAINIPEADSPDDRLVASRAIVNLAGRVIAAFELTLENGLKHPENGSLGLYMNSEFFKEPKRDFGLRVELGKFPGKEMPSIMTMGIKFPDLPSVTGQTTINNGELINKPDKEIFGCGKRIIISVIYGRYGNKDQLKTSPGMVGVRIPRSLYLNLLLWVFSLQLTPVFLLLQDILSVNLRS